MTAQFGDVPLDTQIKHFLTELGWGWSHPRITSWVQRCGFAHPTQLTDKCKLSLVKFLFEFQTVCYLMSSRGLGPEYLTQWMAENGYQGCMPLKAYMHLRSYLEALDETIPF
jgi:hypothetical protein